MGLIIPTSRPPHPYFILLKKPRVAFSVLFITHGKGLRNEMLNAPSHKNLLARSEEKLSTDGC